ncbi:ATP-dependent DNA helicase PIF1-like [Capsicum annuum]|uniref:ATP-dependent DNA helicase PIF1-like n=1 Tax=Capsicum annuum TaxID=4072 RepID=UPI001FB1601D|nr:ATP-dependent DNA helicase PIF1-like [Capsicum annuum]
MSKQRGGAKLIKKAKLIIWKEAPMASRWKIEIVDRSFRDILDIDSPFGGKVIVFGGDFRQVLPIFPKSTRAEMVNASLVKPYLWHQMKKIKLTRNIRARTDSSFSKLLLRIGNGEEPIIRDDLVLLPKQLVIEIKSDGTGTDALLEKIFPELDKNIDSAKFMTERAILANRNEFVDQLNEMLISRFPGERRTLVLKKNVPIMLLRNLDAFNGLCNGTRMICRGFDNNVIYPEIMMAQNAFKHVFIPRIQLSPPKNEG